MIILSNNTLVSTLTLLNQNVTRGASNIMSINQLQLARALELPSREAMLHREFSVQQFWQNNAKLLSDAWKEWEESEQGSHFKLDETLIDPKLREAVNLSWEDPTKELAVKNLLHEVVPGVFEFQFFDQEKIAGLRDYLEKVADAQIPLRPPYGIALNRGGAMLDSRSEGYLGAPAFQAFYQAMLDKYMRPIGRLLFPEIIGYDTQGFGFSIRYQPSKDTSLRNHTDASAVTLNVNMNLPGEAFTGSNVDFIDRNTGRATAFTFTPGSAAIHRGSVVHAAQPIKTGERSNLVLWLFGDKGQTPMQSDTQIDIDPTERWVVPTAIKDGYAPF